MDSLQRQRSRIWQQVIDGVTQDYRRLSVDERQWIAARLEKIATLQWQLDDLFRRGAGESACRDCQGGCCAKGQHHVTLANLLGYLQRGELPPSPDFTQTCPFLSEQGCRIAVADRPYNCISFVCDIIEAALTPAEVQQFYLLEQSLRTVYREFAERYQGGGMTGVLLQGERLSGRSFLSRKEGSKQPMVATGSC